MSAEHLRAITEAKVRTRKVRRAAKVASFNGWSMVCFAGLTALGVLFGDWTSGVLTVILLAIALNELRGGKMLARFEERGARVLGYNQIALAVFIVAYAGWSMYSASHNAELQASLATIGDAQSAAMVSGLADLMTYGVYGGVAVVGLLGPGLTALYYFSRARYVREAVQGKPGWVVEMLRVVG